MGKTIATTPIFQQELSLVSWEIFLRDWIIAAWMPGVALAQAFDDQPKGLKYRVFRQRFDCIIGEIGVEAATRGD